MAADDLDFTRDAILASLRPKSAMKKSALIVAVAIGALMIVGGGLFQADFWALWLAGTRANATITARQENQIGWIRGRSGRPYPLMETHFHYTFAPANDGNIQAMFIINASSEDWRPGDQLEVMYRSAEPQHSRPASLSFYLENDTAWTMAMATLVGGLLTFSIGAIALLRIRAQDRSQRTDPASEPHASP